MSYKKLLQNEQRRHEAELNTIKAQIGLPDLLREYAELWTPNSEWTRKERYHYLSRHQATLYLSQVDSLTYVREFILLLQEDDRLEFTKESSYSDRIAAYFKVKGMDYRNLYGSIEQTSISFDFDAQHSERCELVVVSSEMIESNTYELQCNGAKV